MVVKLETLFCQSPLVRASKILEFREKAYLFSDLVQQASVIPCSGELSDYQALLFCLLVTLYLSHVSGEHSCGAIRVKTTWHFEARVQEQSDYGQRRRNRMWVVTFVLASVYCYLVHKNCFISFCVSLVERHTVLKRFMIQSTDALFFLLFMHDLLQSIHILWRRSVYYSHGFSMLLFGHTTKIPRRAWSSASQPPWVVLYLSVCSSSVMAHSFDPAYRFGELSWV